MESILFCWRVAAPKSYSHFCFCWFGFDLANKSFNWQFTEIFMVCSNLMFSKILRCGEHFITKWTEFICEWFLWYKERVRKVRWPVSFRHLYRSLISPRHQLNCGFLISHFIACAWKINLMRPTGNIWRHEWQSRIERSIVLVDWANARAFVVIKYSMWKTNSDKMHQLRISTCRLTMCIASRLHLVGTHLFA